MGNCHTSTETSGARSTHSRRRARVGIPALAISLSAVSPAARLASGKAGAFLVVKGNWKSATALDIVVLPTTDTEGGE